MMTACRVQTIFSGSFMRYFGVLDGDDDGQDQERSAGTNSVWDIVKRERDEEERPAAPIAAQAPVRLPDNRLLWDPFLVHTRWDLMFSEEHSSDDYVRFAGLPQDDEGASLKRLPRMALEYIHLVSDEVSSGQIVLRKRMLTLRE